MEGSIGEERAYKLMEELLWTIEEYVSLAAVPKSYGTELKFFRLDIHLIGTVGNNPGINVTEIARIHKITKSAVSQAMKKLVSRGLVHRFQVPENRKEVLFELTDTGRAAFNAHRAFHERVEKPYVSEIASFQETDEAGIRKLLDLLSRRAAEVRRLEGME